MKQEKKETDWRFLWRTKYEEQLGRAKNKGRTALSESEVKRLFYLYGPDPLIGVQVKFNRTEEALVTVLEAATEELWGSGGDLKQKRMKAVIREFVARFKIDKNFNAETLLPNIRGWLRTYASKVQAAPLPLDESKSILSKNRITGAELGRLLGKSQRRIQQLVYTEKKLKKHGDFFDTDEVKRFMKSSKKFSDLLEAIMSFEKRRKT